LRLRGVGNTTRREIATAVRLLREQLGNPRHAEGAAGGKEPEPPAAPIDSGSYSVDLLAQRVTPLGARESESTHRTLQALLGLDLTLPEPWPSQADVARGLDVTRARVGQVLGKYQQRWSKDPAITRLRADVVDILHAEGGVMVLAELREAVLVARGSIQDEPQRTRLAIAVTPALRSRSNAPWPSHASWCVVTARASW
jgi:hypothetical protein